MLEDEGGGLEMDEVRLGVCSEKTSVGDCRGTASLFFVVLASNWSGGTGHGAGLSLWRGTFVEGGPGSADELTFSPVRLGVGLGLSSTDSIDVAGVVAVLKEAFLEVD